MPATKPARLSDTLKRRARPADLVEAVRRSILSGRLPPGTPLRQDEIAAAHGVSKIPVREALLHLVAEGLVVLQPNRGFTVASLAAGEADELLDMRAVLECHIVRLAVPEMTDADIARAHDILDEAEATSDINRWSELNWEFHGALYAPAHRARLAAVIRQVSNPTDAYIRVLLNETDYRGLAEREHRAILAACDVRNADAAASLLDQHIRTTGLLLSRFQQQQQSEAKATQTA